jgi:hypothetical protein
MGWDPKRKNGRPLGGFFSLSACTDAESLEHPARGPSRSQELDPPRLRGATLEQSSSNRCGLDLHLVTDSVLELRLVFQLSAPVAKTFARKVPVHMSAARVHTFPRAGSGGTTSTPLIVTSCIQTSQLPSRCRKEPHLRGCRS